MRINSNLNSLQDIERAYVERNGEINIVRKQLNPQYKFKSYRNNKSHKRAKFFGRKNNRNIVKMERANTNPHISSFILKRNKDFPNSELPVLIYRKALNLPAQKNKAADIAQTKLIHNGWSNSWRNGIFDFHHYHSTTHECLAICMGSADVILGGPNGRRVILKQGDLIILPAGVGHRCTAKTSDFLCVGAYPDGKDYDINTGTPEEYKKAIIQIKTIPNPKHDPLYGDQGFLRYYWK